MKLFYRLCLSLLSFSAFADPFYAENTDLQAGENTPNFAKNSSETTACKPPLNANKFNISSAFDTLTLVGIVQHDQQFKALFTDEKQHLIDFRVNDYLANQQIQISQIDLKTVTYIDWQKTTQCEQPYQVILKL